MSYLEKFHYNVQLVCSEIGTCTSLPVWCESLPKGPLYSSRYSQGCPGASKMLGAAITSQGSKGRALGERERWLDKEHGQMVNWGSK